MVSSGALWFGASPVACGSATTTNTDSISIAGSVGTTEKLVLDQRGGVFGPGFTPESNIPEIEITTTLGDATDTVVVYATEGRDNIAPGQNGLSLNADGDVDVTFTPSAFSMEIYGLGGDDYINGRGQGGAGLHFLGTLRIEGGEGDDILLRGSEFNDVITGGPGNDNIQGMEGNDLLDGGSGDDTIGAGAGDGDVTGGPGRDSFAGSGGNDTFHADDGEADISINGGPDTDTAYDDVGVDPNPVGKAPALAWWSASRARISNRRRRAFVGIVVLVGTVPVAAAVLPQTDAWRPCASAEACSLRRVQHGARQEPCWMPQGGCRPATERCAGSLSGYRASGSISGSWRISSVVAAM